MRQVAGLHRQVPAHRERLISGKPSSLYEAGFEQELKQANRGLVLPLISGLLLCALYLFMTSSDILDQLLGVWNSDAKTLCLVTAEDVGSSLWDVHPLPFPIGACTLRNQVCRRETVQTYVYIRM